MLRFIRVLASLILICIVLYGVLAWRVYRVSWDSMSPNLGEGNLVFIDRIFPRVWEIHRWAIVVYNNSGEIKIKRVIGLPGEKIRISDGGVWLLSGDSTSRITESYIGENVRTCVPGGCTEFEPYIYEIPLKSYFVLGDNRLNSRDSRWCVDVADCSNTSPLYIPQNEIIGTVIFIW